MNKKNIEYWVMFNGLRGILYDDEFIAEQDLDKRFRQDALVTGEMAYGNDSDDLNAEDYSYDCPCEVVYADVSIEREDGFWTLEKHYQREDDVKIDEAYRQLVVDTGWKADWMSERTKMKKRIDECRKDGMPCGFLRAEWNKVIKSFIDDYEDLSYQCIIDEWSDKIDFFTLVEEVDNESKDVTEETSDDE